jgi:hypothetical protein
VTNSKAMNTAVALLVVVACAACSSTHKSSAAATTAPGAPATSPPAAVVDVPVATCSTTTAGSQPSTTLGPGHAAVTLATAVADRLWLYSDGRTMVLAPRRWICSASVGADGSTSMFVVPAGSVSSTNPELDYPGVFVNTDDTGRGFGQALVCGYFPNSAAARVGLLCDHPPKGTKTKPLSADVVSFTHGPTSGVAIYPDASNATANVDVVKISCDAGTLCTEILRDAVTRFKRS